MVGSVATATAMVSSTEDQTYRPVYTRPPRITPRYNRTQLTATKNVARPRTAPRKSRLRAGTPAFSSKGNGNKMRSALVVMFPTSATR